MFEELERAFGFWLMVLTNPALMLLHLIELTMHALGWLQ